MLHRIAIAVVGAVLALTVAVPWALAEKSPEGARHFREGNDHYGAGRFEQAAASFRKAYDIDRAPVLLYNVAKCMDKLGRFPEAIGLMERYLEEQPDAPNRVAVEVEIRLLEEKASLTRTRVAFESDPPGAVVRLAGRDEPVGETPVRTWLPFGAHDVSVSLRGYLTQERTVQVARGVPETVRFELVSEDAPGRIQLLRVPDGARVELDGRPAGVTPLKRPLTVRPGPHRIRVTHGGEALVDREVAVGAGETVYHEARPSLADAGGGPGVVVSAPATADDGGFEVPWYGWTTIGLTAAGLGSGVAFIVLAADKHDEASGYAQRVDGDPATLRGLVDDRDTYATIGYASFGVAGAAAIGTGLILWLHNSGDDDGGPAVSLAPLQPLGRGSGLSVLGRF